MKRLNIKLVAILANFCRTAHYNNNNYLLLFVIGCFYSAGARVDTITWLNYLELSILYYVLQKKLETIISLGIL